MLLPAQQKAGAVVRNYANMKFQKLTMKRVCLYAAIIVVAGLTILYFGGYWYLRNAYKFEYHDPSFFSSMTNDLKATPPPPANFKHFESRINRNRATYESQYKEYFCNNVLFISTHRKSNLPGNFSKEVYEIEKKKYNREYEWKLFVDESLVYSFGLENEFGVDKLNNFYYNNCEYQVASDNNRKISLYGIQSISKYKFGKPVDSLNTDQLIELYLLCGDKSRNYFLSDTTKYLARMKVLKTFYERDF